MAPRLGRVEALDGIRGIAILAVVGYHLFALPGGFLGVDVFFVLSGFLITTLLLEERDARGRISLRAFYARRARRLLPALGALLLVFVLLTAPVAGARSVEIAAAGGVYAANLMRVLDHTFRLGPLGPLWSLAEEEQFYVVWPVLLLVLSRRLREPRILLLLAVGFVVLVAYRIGLAQAGASWTRLYYAPDTHLDGLTLGCALACARRLGARVPQVAGWVGLGVLAAGLAVAHDESVAWMAYGLPVWELAAAILVGAALEPCLLRRALTSRILVWVGLISYSLYLWHEFVFALLGWRNGIVALPLALLLAALSYYRIERRFRRGMPREEPPAAVLAAA